MKNKMKNEIRKPFKSTLNYKEVKQAKLDKKGTKSRSKRREKIIESRLMEICGCCKGKIDKENDLDENEKQYKCYFCSEILCCSCVEDIQYVNNSPYVPRYYPTLTGCKKCKKDSNIKKKFKCKSCGFIGEFGSKIHFCDTCDNTLCNCCLYQCSMVETCENSKHGHHIACVCSDCGITCKKCKKSFCESCVDGDICWDCRDE